MTPTVLSNGKVSICDIDAGDKGNSRGDGQLLGRVQGRSSSRGLGSGSRVVADGHGAKGNGGTDHTSSGGSDDRHVGLGFCCCSLRRVERSCCLLFVAVVVENDGLTKMLAKLLYPFLLLIFPLV